MKSRCQECLHFEVVDCHQDIGNVGKCLLAEKKWGGEVHKPWNAAACKGFEDKITGRRPLRKFQGVRRPR